MNIKLKIFLVIPVLFTSALSQNNDYPWQTILNRDSLKISFIFYNKSIGEKNGVVLKLENQSGKKMSYNFDVVFKNSEMEYSEIVAGTINPYEIKTGSENKLFFVPFKMDKSIAEVGIRKLKITVINN